MLPRIRHVQILCWSLNTETIDTPSSVNSMSFCEYIRRIANTLQGFHRLRSLEVKFHFSQRSQEKWNRRDVVEVAARSLMVPFLRLRGLGKVGVVVSCHMFQDGLQFTGNTDYMELRSEYVDVFRRILMGSGNGEAPSIERVRMMK